MLAQESFVWVLCLILLPHYGNHLNSLQLLNPQAQSCEHVHLKDILDLQDCLPQHSILCIVALGAYCVCAYSEKCFAYPAKHLYESILKDNK